MAKKTSYPYRRKKARRDKNSYKAKTPEARQRQLDNLRLGRARKRPDSVKPGKVSYEQLQALSIVEFAEYVLGISFKERPAQRVILKSIYGMPLDIAERDIYSKITTNDEVFEETIEKDFALLCLGARSGKSLLSSIIVLYESVQDKWRQYVSKDELSYGVLVATRLEQAQSIVQANCARLVGDSRISYLILESWATSLKLKNNSCIASFPANSTSGRGLPIHCLIFDELAHFQTGDSPKADHLIFDALYPRTAQFPGAKVLMISTPASKSGLFFDELDRGFQVPMRFTCQASTAIINPLIPSEFFQKEKERDIDNYLREFEAIPAEAVDAYLPSDKILEALVLPGDLLAEPSHRYYMGCDQSGLAGKDRFAIAISHKEGAMVVTDLLRSWQTSSGKTIMAEISQIARDYNIGSVIADRYAGGWVKEAFESIGLEMQTREPLPVIYANFKSLCLAGRLSLPNSRELKDGLLKTVAYFGRNNSLSIAHPRDSSGHGDSADAIATSVFAASSKMAGGFFSKAIEYQRSLIGACNG